MNEDRETNVLQKDFMADVPIVQCQFSGVQTSCTCPRVHADMGTRACITCHSSLGLTFLLLPLLGFSVLVLTLLFQVVLNCPFGDLLPS
jgi:hypothetical protein